VGELEASDRAVFLAQSLQPLVKQCKAMEKVFQAIATAPADRKCELMAVGTAEAMVECQCPDMEEDLLAYLYAANLGASDGTQAVALEVRIDPAAKLPKGKTWGEVAKTLAADTGAEPKVIGPK
jgi:hypothetical protein